MPILFLIPDYSRHGGLEIYNEGVARVLSELGHDVDALVINQNRIEPVPRMNIQALKPSSPASRLLYHHFWPRYLDHVLARRPPRARELVLCGHACLLPQALRYARRHHRPCWCLAFGLEVWGELGPDVRQALAEVDRLITISRFTEYHLRLASGRTTPVDLIPPFVDTDRYAPRPARPRTHGRSRLLTVSRLAGGERYKGHDLVLQAMVRLQSATPPVPELEYWIAGEGDDRPRLEAFARALGVAARTRFLGRVPDADLPGLYNDCDIFIMPSWVAETAPGRWTGEGFGIVYAEASACAKPVLGCTEGGQVDVILDGVTGRLVQPTVEDVAQGVRDILTDPAAARRFGEAGRNYICSTFAWPHFVGRWQTLLESIPA